MAAMSIEKFGAKERIRADEAVERLVRMKSYIYTSKIRTSSLKEACKVGSNEEDVPRYSGSPSSVRAGDVLQKEKKYWLVLPFERFQDVTDIFDGYNMRQ